MTELEKFEWFDPSPIEPFNLGRGAAAGERGRERRAAVGLPPAAAADRAGPAPDRGRLRVRPPAPAGERAHG